MKKIFMFLLFFPLLSFADNAWYVSIPSYRIDPSAPFNSRFQYTSVLYLTDQGLQSQEPLNYDCSNGCWVGVNTQNSGNPNDPRYIDPEQENVYFKGTTVGDALTALYERVGSFYYVSSATAPDRINEGIVWCGAVGLSRSGSGPSYRVMAGGECGKLPNPPNLECSLQTSNVDLDHGELTLDEVDGNSVSGEFIIRCNQDAQLLLTLISPDEEDSDPSEGTRVVLKKNELYSIITINNEPAVTQTIFEVDEDDTTFTVTSTLERNGFVSPGPFSAFAYVVMSYL